MKKIIYLASLLLIGVVFFFACSKQEKVFDLSATPLSEKESFELFKSDDVQRIVILQNKFLDQIRNAAAHGVSMTEIKSAMIDAMKNKKETKFLTLVFGSETAGNSFISELQTARQDFFAKYPVLVKNQQAYVCTECQATADVQIDKFFRNFNYFDKNRLPILSNSATFSLHQKTNMVEDPGDSYDPGTGGSDTPTCGSWWQQTKLVICAGLCSASTAGVGTALCGWACWCMLCPNNSELSKLIC